jgi:UDP-glucuronate 4-epimerase
VKILITGAAGFIGSYLAKRLSEAGFDTVGIDNLNDYYEVRLKYDRLKVLGGIRENEISDTGFSYSTIFSNYRFLKGDVSDRGMMARLFQTEKFDRVCHMAAQAGVRYSIENPYAYVDSNINGFITVLEGCRQNNVARLVYASSSSVYGTSDTFPVTEDFRTDMPLSLYAATKKANELMAYTYSHLYKISTTGLRLFTVYGPWGRPDMAPFIFTRAILNGENIKAFNNGDHYRDYTYIDDITESIYRVLVSGSENESLNNGNCRIYNIGNSRPVALFDLIKSIEKNCGKKAVIENLPMQPGDVHTTYADISNLKKVTGYSPQTTVEEGIAAFISWFREYYDM